MEFSHIAIKKDFIETLEAILTKDIPKDLYSQITFKLNLLKMKTISDINQEIEHLKKEISEVRTHEKDKRKAKRMENGLSEKIRFRSLMKMYLESSPLEESLRFQYDSLLKNKEVTENRYETWRVRASVAEKGNDPKARYAEVSGLTDTNRKIKTLKYLLDI